jgi:hypothetical protein
MIVEIIDQGWGPEHPLKQMEMEIVDRYLRPCINDSTRTVIINSTWYDMDLHQRLQERFLSSTPDRIVLVSMLDAAIVKPEQFTHLPCEVRAVGYYKGQDWIDYWSLVVDNYMIGTSRNLLDENDIDTAFMCLNRKPHWHRLNLYNQMSQTGLLDLGLVSMGSDGGPALRLLTEDSGGSDLAPNGGTEQHGIANDIVSLGHPKNWQRHFLNIVTETQWDVSTTTFVTEKIYKPIIGLRPFLVYAPDGARTWLDHHGFAHYIDDFRELTDLDLGDPGNLVPFIKILVAQGRDYWRSKYLDFRQKILHNRLQFDRHVKAQNDRINQGMH